MYGISCDTIRREYKTKNSKGPAPYWGHDAEKFRFRKIVAPQMAMIRLSVYDDVRNKVTFNFNTRKPWDPGTISKQLKLNFYTLIV